MTLPGLLSYLAECRQPTHPATVVTGHAAPDADTVVSALIEAYRRRLTGERNILPVVQTSAIPAEIAFLLETAADRLPLTGDPAVAALLAEESTRFILTDHHTDPLANGRVIAIVDHHMPADGTELTGIDTIIEPVGAATTLVALCCRERGLQPDAALARMMLGAILADTEGLSPAKTRPKDAEAAAWLAALSGEEPGALFAALRERLLAEKDLTVLYQRDYRLFADASGAPLLGFAVIKVWDTTPIDEERLQRMLEDDRQRTGAVACIAKVSRYAADGIHGEDYRLAAAPADAEMLTGLLLTLCGDTAAPCGGGIRVPPDGKHLSRKRLVPFLLPLLKKD